LFASPEADDQVIGLVARGSGVQQLSCQHLGDGVTHGTGFAVRNLNIP
jgi:hypothetical protein